MKDLEKIIKKNYAIYNKSDQYEQAIEVGCDDEIILMRYFAKDLIKEIKSKIDKLPNITFTYESDTIKDIMDKLIEDTSK